MASPSVFEGTPRKNPQSPRKKGAECEVEDGLPYRPASWHLWRDHRVFVPFATIQNWVEAGGKKGAGAHGHGLP